MAWGCYVLLDFSCNRHQDDVQILFRYSHQQMSSGGGGGGVSLRNKMDPIGTKALSK